MVKAHKSNPGFWVTRGRGFQIRFENGYMISVQFGPGNYCDNYDMDIDDQNSIKAGQQGSTTAEVAVINPNNILMELPNHDDTVTNRSTPTEVLELINWAASL
jgi:hypothetical protein